ncbi:Acetyl esterase/lipase [Erythrobacter litoralis]|uniref:Esterase n=1 Tax=Erythrobacter litoralis TaxID=39960 RepID=A0A074N2Z8_9SPHN|nr:alpha/beta hydrolase [Erythrobacter litoralis]AOL22526.1 Acetyl esterase/lipase [Erythrobacter litoralis]KEO92342.1 esterase [Erythrobacter litoralis]
MLEGLTAELRRARASFLMRAVVWLMKRRKPVFPHSPEGFREKLSQRDCPRDAPMPAKFEQRFIVERRTLEGQEVVTLHPKSGPGEWHMLYFHGGGFVLPMFDVHWPLAAALVETCSLSITLPLYKVVPEASASVQDALADACFAELAMTHAPERIVLSGDSAGGHMALALALRLARAGGPQPGRLALFAPWLDLTMRDEAMRAVEPHDVMLKIGTLRATGEIYADGRDPASPECSPLYTPADQLAQLPPTRIWTGRHDLFIVDSRTFAGKLRDAGVDSKLYEYEGAPHVFMAITPTREAKDVFGLMKDFLES